MLSMSDEELDDIDLNGFDEKRRKYVEEEKARRQRASDQIKFQVMQSESDRGARKWHFKLSVGLVAGIILGALAMIFY
jgi:F0F1-type ATP synthase assembly protein I